MQSFSVTSFSFFLSFTPPNYKCSTIGLLTIGELASFPGWFIRHSKNTGCFFHHPHEEVVNVVLQFPDVGVFSPKELSVSHQLLQHLLVGQAPVPCSGIERVAVLEQDKDCHFSRHDIRDRFRIIFNFNFWFFKP